MDATKTDFHEYIEKRLTKLEGSFEKILSLKLQGTNVKIGNVYREVVKINGRLLKAEVNIRELQDLKLQNKSMQEFIADSDKKRELSENKRNRVLLATVAVVSLLVGVLTLIINYMFFNP